MAGLRDKIINFTSFTEVEQVLLNTDYLPHFLHSDFFCSFREYASYREVSCFQNCVFKYLSYLGSKLQFLWAALLLNSKCHFKNQVWCLFTPSEVSCPLGRLCGAEWLIGFFYHLNGFWSRMWYQDLWDRCSVRLISLLVSFLSRTKHTYFLMDRERNERSLEKFDPFSPPEHFNFNFLPTISVISLGW